MGRERRGGRRRLVFRRKSKLDTASRVYNKGWVLGPGFSRYSWRDDKGGCM